MLPSGHVLQASDPVAPLTVPSGQGSHGATPLSPKKPLSQTTMHSDLSLLGLFPLSQGMHPRRSATEIVLRGQGWHFLDPGVLLNVPGEQRRQNFPPAPKKPSGHNLGGGVVVVVGLVVVGTAVVDGFVVLGMEVVVTVDLATFFGRLTHTKRFFLRR